MFFGVVAVGRFENSAAKDPWSRRAPPTCDSGVSGLCSAARPLFFHGINEYISIDQIDIPSVAVH